MNCIYCGKKLPIVKKFTSEEFCSAAHRQAYLHEQEQLSVERLQEDQARQKPVRKQQIVKEKAEDQPAKVVGQYLTGKIAPRAIASRPWHAEIALLVAKKASKFEAHSKIEANSKIVVTRTGLAEAEECSKLVTPSGAAPVEDAMAALSASQMPSTLSPIESRASINSSAALAIPLKLGIDLRLGQERPVELNLAPQSIKFSLKAKLPALRESAGGVEPGNRFRPAELPQLPKDVSALALGVESEAPKVVRPVTGLETSHEVPMGAEIRIDNKKLRAIRPMFRPSSQPQPYLPNLAPFIAPEGQVAEIPSPSVVCYAGSIPRLFSRPRPQTPRSGREGASGVFPPPLPPTLLPAQSKTAHSILQRPKGRCQCFESLLLHPASFLRSVSGNWDPTSSPFSFNDPFSPKARIATVRRSSLSVFANTTSASRQLRLRLEAIAGPLNKRMRGHVAPQRLPVLKPQLDLRILPAQVTNSPFAALSPVSNSGYRRSWEALRQRWHDAPNDLRWIALAVPLVIVLIWFADSPSAQAGAKGRIASMVPNVSGLWNVSFSGDSLKGLKQMIQRRAAVELSDDFRQGLGDWSGVGEWAKGWRYDPPGFIRPRKLALYTPSLGLEDYRFEFLGAIERKALSWVFRAADVKNYYVTRLEVSRGGPLPNVELVRYAVVDGRVGSRKSFPLPMQVRLDTIYRVRVDVRGSDFVTMIQGQVVDVFSDDRLRRGGVGFFSESGEDARLRWVEVSHQYDMLGRLCAYLMPYNVSNSNVRSVP